MTDNVSSVNKTTLVDEQRFSINKTMLDDEQRFSINKTTLVDKQGFFSPGDCPSSLRRTPLRSSRPFCRGRRVCRSPNFRQTFCAPEGLKTNFIFFILKRFV